MSGCSKARVFAVQYQRRSCDATPVSCAVKGSLSLSLSRSYTHTHTPTHIHVTVSAYIHASYIHMYAPTHDFVVPCPYAEASLWLLLPHRKKAQHEIKHGSLAPKPCTAVSCYTQLPCRTHSRLGGAAPAPRAPPPATRRPWGAALPGDSWPTGSRPLTLGAAAAGALRRASL